jgi:hypothetical protein
VSENNQPLPADWDKVIESIGSALAEAMKANERREQSCAGWRNVVNWETWEAADKQLAERIARLPHGCEVMNDIDEALAQNESSLRDYVHAVEGLRLRVQSWLLRDKGAGVPIRERA